MRIKTDVKANYKAVFNNGKTIRLRLDPNLPISTPQYAEIEDVAINNKCAAACSYCYTNALKSGSNFTNIVDKAIEVWDKPLNNKPLQIAIGGAGESTLHPDWIEFVKTVNQLDITPNYTTNGMHLSDDILAATEQYCGGVAVSYHPHIDKVFHSAIDKLSSIKTQLNTHLIIGSEKSLIDAQSLFDLYQDDIKYFVMLPYQAAGRASHIEVNNTWRLMFEWISSLDKASRNKFAFGALFYDWLLLNKIDLKIDVYEPEIYSGYRIMDDSFKTLRKSSYNLEEK